MTPDDAMRVLHDMAQSRVCDLIPGDLVELAGMSAVYVAQTTHPIWPHLQLVVWRLPDGSWSHDALDARQVVGEVQPATSDVRRQRLRAALIGVRHS